MKWRIQAMKLKTSFFKKQIIRQDVRQFGWISIVFFLLLCFIIPLELLQLSSSDFLTYNEYQDYFAINTELQIMILLSLPVAAGLLLFRYIHNEAAVDMVHSLPIRRESLYVSHLLSGLVMLLVPILLTSVITYFVTRSIPEFHDILTVSELMSWTGLIIVLTCMFFTFTVMVGMITGLSTAHAVLTYIFLFLPIGLTTMITYNLSFLLFGYASSLLNEKIYYLSPFTRFIRVWDNNIMYSAGEVMIYILLTVLFIIVGLFFYKGRQLERATEVITFTFLKPVFKYGVTFCSMLVGGTYYSATTSANFSWLIFGYILGALIGYTAAEMILQKTWRIFQLKMFTGYVIYMVIFGVIFISIENDYLQYESKLPRMDQIQNVYFGDTYFLHEETENKALYSDSKLYIQAVRELHEHILEEREYIQSVKSDSEIRISYQSIVYRLNNGQLFKREYRIPIELLEDKLQIVMESDEYKANLPEIRQIDETSDPIDIRLFPHAPGFSPVTISDKGEIQELQEAISKDVKSQTMDDLLYRSSTFGYIELSYEPEKTKLPGMEPVPTETIHIDWRKSFKHTEEWLKERGYYEKLTITEADLAQVELMKISPQEPNKEYLATEEYFQQATETLPITEKEEIENILAYFNRDYSSDHIYYVKLTLKNGQTWYGSLEEEKILESIKKKVD